MSAGSIAVPTIMPLRPPVVGELKNVIDSNTLIELKSGTSGSKIYYTVDNTKPEPFRKLGENTTLLYKEPFMLRCGKRIVKALAQIRDGRESNIVTKVFDVKYAAPAVPSDSDSDTREDNDENFKIEMARQNKRMTKRITSSIIDGVPLKLDQVSARSPPRSPTFSPTNKSMLSHRTSEIRRSSTFSTNYDMETVKCVYCDAPRPKNSFARFCGKCGKPVPVEPGASTVEPGSMGMCTKCRSYIPLSQPRCIVCEEPIAQKLKPVSSVRFEGKIICGSCGTRNPSGLTHCASCEHRFPGPVHSDESAAPLPKLDGQLVRCPVCVRVNNPDARFCDWCGSKPVPEQSPLVCSLCKVNNPPYSRFCANCGASFAAPNRLDPRNPDLGDEMCENYPFQDLPMWQAIPMPSVPKSPRSTRVLPAPRPRKQDQNTQTVGLFFPGGKKMMREQEELAQMRSVEFRMRDKNPPLTAISPGKGYWRKQLDHVCGHIRGYTTNEVEFRSIFGEPRLGKITGAAVDETEDEMTISFTFALKGHTDFGDDGTRGLQHDIYQNHQRKFAFGSTFNPEKENEEKKKTKKKLKSTRKGHPLKNKLDKMNPEDRLLIKEVGPKGSGRVSELKELLMEGADANCCDGDGISALHHSVMQNRIACVKALLNAGCNINKQAGPNQNTPLHEAVKLGPAGKDLVELLLENNAKTTIKNSKNMTAYELAVKADYNSLIMIFNAHEGKKLVSKMTKPKGHMEKRDTGKISYHSSSETDDDVDIF